MAWRERSWPTLAASTITAIAAVMTLMIGIRYGTFAAADSDPYGYVSQADLMAHATLSIDQRFVDTMPWPDADRTFTPPGYVTKPDGFIVPAYSPGLPLVMAAFQRVKGRQAVFYVVPLLGALAVWMTGRLGARVHSPLTGMLASVLLPTAVIFLYQVVQPVSDVAVMSWWTISLALTVEGRPLAALGAGLAGSMAVLTRPNLIPLGVVIALFGGWEVARARENNRRRAALWLVSFSLGLAPGCIAVAAINQHLFGSPLQSGYGSLRAFYSWAHLLPNLALYPHWLSETSAGWLCLALGAPWLFHFRAEPTSRGLSQQNYVLLLLAFSGAVFLSYLFYVPWGREQWGYLRFLLPSFPPLIVLSVGVVLDTVRRFSKTNRAPWAVAIVLGGALAVWQSLEAIRLGAFTTQSAEQRYVAVGRYVAAALPANAVFVTGAQAGSLRYYSGRSTIRIDMLDGDWLDRAVESLQQKGYHPYILLEEEEEGPFRDRFAKTNALGRLDWPPSAERAQPTRVRIYDPADRARFFSGAPIITSDIGFIGRPKLTTK